MTRRCQALSLILVLLMLAGAFCGCTEQPQGAATNEPHGQSTPGGGQGDQATPEPVKDTLVFSINADIVSIDCHMARDTVSAIVLRQMYDTLVRDQPGEGLVPGLAESWEFSADNLQLTFKIREGVKFHNGDTMTAEDVAFSLNRAIASSFTSSFSGTMDRAEVLDSTHVRLYMKQAFGPVLQCLSVPCMGVVSKRAVEELGDEGFAAAPVGTGPYKFVEWKSGEKVVLGAFDEYYRGSPAIKDLTFVIMSDRSTAAIALENNEIDVLYAPDVADRAQLESLDNVQFLTGNGSVYMWIIAFNNESGIFADKRLREAISYAIDREEILAGALNGFGEPVEMPIVPSVFGYDESFENHEYDLDKARQLMAEAGYPDGFSVTIKLNQSTTYTRPAEIVQAQLRKIGIDLQFELMERAAFLSDVTTNCDYEITLFMFTAGYPDADYVLYGRMHSGNIGGTNYLKYSNPEVDVLLDEARASTDPARRKELYWKVSEYVRDDVPFIPLITDHVCIAANSGLSGVQASAGELHYVFDYAWTK